jgi:lipoprotein-anchoring transpeptidase ErfK/SrfK
VSIRLFRRSPARGATAVLALVSILSACAPAAVGSRRPSGAKAFGAARPSAERGVVEAVDDSSRTYLLLRLQERTLYMVTYDVAGGAPTDVQSFPVAIGRREYETPTGVFAVTDKATDPDWVQFDWKDPSRAIRLVPPGPDNPLGRRWIGFASGYGWQIGFHGTPHPELLGQAVSHGCVRMRNDDVVKVYDRVRIGTVVIVQP